MKNKYGMTSEDKTWNMDDAFCERINERLDELDKATHIGHQLYRFRILWTIYADTHFKYPDKRDELDRKFEEIRNDFDDYSPKKTAVEQNFSIMVLTGIEQQIDKLVFTITKLLYENDLIYLKKKKYVNPEVEVENDY